ASLRPQCCVSRWSPLSNPARGRSPCASSSAVARRSARRCAFPSKGRSVPHPMHWVALHFPRLRQQALSRGHAPPDPEREALEAIAAWACQFTPRVSLEPPRELLLEVSASLRYFGGRWKFLAQLRAGLTALGFEARLAEASTPRSALWHVRGEGRRLEL